MALPSSIAVGAGPLLEARRIQAWYGSSYVLQGIDLDIGRGESVGLLGRNGMGKTTLIRTLLGHVKQREGHVLIRGRATSRAAPHEVARLGVAYVPEGRGVFPNLTARENLEMAARASVDGRRDWTLERVLGTFPRLAARMGHLGSQLSGGEQQMIAIGRALMTNPLLIMLDEATEGLAPLVVSEIWRVIESIRAAGIATLIVDRNYRRVATHTDRLVVLQKGQVVITGRSSELRESEALTRYLGL
jgi:branched-chain amino acid transport system ATP-binding protein